MTNNKVVDAKIHPNGQLTFPKDKREELGIEEGDRVYFEVIKVIGSDGQTKYEKEVKEHG